MRSRLLSDWCLEVDQRQQVMVGTTTLAEPLVRALHGAILERGAWPLELSPRNRYVSRVQ
jgi:leucyl aminopeptidase (aminopeptidase T)